MGQNAKSRSDAKTLMAMSHQYDPTPAPVPQETMQGLLPKPTNLSLTNAPQTQFSDMLGQSPDQQKQFISNSLTGAPQGQNMLNPNLLQPQAQQPTQASYDQFAQQQQVHPEWFQGDTYVGDQSRQQPEQQPQSQSQPQPQQNNYQLKNGLGTPKEQTLQDVKNQHMRAMYQAAAQLAKDGHDPKQFLPLLQQATNDKIADANNRVAQQQQEQAYSVLGSNADYKTKFIAGVRAGMKPELLKMALDNGMTFHNINLNDRQLPIAYDKHNNQAINMLTGQPVTESELQNGVNPTAVYNKNTVSADAQYRVANRPEPRGYSGSGGRSTGGRISSGPTASQINQANGELGKFNKWQQDNPMASGMDYPYKEKLWNAQEILGQGGGNDTGNADTSQPQSSNPDGAAWYDNTVRATMQQYGVDQTTAQEIVSRYITSNGG